MVGAAATLTLTRILEFRVVYVSVCCLGFGAVCSYLFISICETNVLSFLLVYYYPSVFCFYFSLCALSFFFRGTANRSNPLRT